jgi:hypothetical protein
VVVIALLATVFSYGREGVRKKEMCIVDISFEDKSSLIKISDDYQTYGVFYTGLLHVDKYLRLRLPFQREEGQKRQNITPIR